jgi:hypothetical protein
MTTRTASEWLAAAKTAAERGDVWSSVDCLRAALDRRDPLGEYWAAAAKLAGQIGYEWGAVRAAQRLYDETPKSVTTSFILAATLSNAGRASQAADLLLPLADSGQLPPDLTFKLTRFLMFAGRLAEAQRRARALLPLQPYSPTLWERIAQTKRFEVGDSDIDEMRRVFDQWPGDKLEGRAAIAGALGRAFVDLGDDKAASQAFDACAAATRAQSPYDIESLEPAARNILQAFDGQHSAATPRDLAGSDRPIFILGVPRSGTSLVDQIFSRHASIKGGGELRSFWLVSHVLGDFTPTPVNAYLHRMKAQPQIHPWREIGRRYLALADERFGAGSRFTDKLLSNMYRVGAIRLALPDARFIWVTRNPLDVAWSCWRARFERDMSWSASPEGIAKFISSFNYIMDGWAKRHPESINKVSYERLVEDADSEIARVVSAVGLLDDRAMREPHLSDRDVMTMSYAQVREPVHTRSVGAAQAFPISTAHLRRALGAAGLEV